MAKDYFFPNYPYNDLGEDPFLLEKSNAFNLECNTWIIEANEDLMYKYTDCFTNTEQGGQLLAGQTIEVCSTSKPILTPSSAGEMEMVEYDTYQLSVSKPVLGNRFVHFYYIDPSGQDQYVFIQVGPFTKSSKTRRIVQVMVDTVPQVVHSNTSKYTIKKISNFGEPQNNAVCYPEHLKAFETDESKYRHVFNSPETSFGQPFLGDILKIESVIFGAGQAHFAEVKNNALYKLITKEAQEDALKSSEEIANAGGSFDSAAMFAAYQSYLQIYLDGITRKNYGWSYNSIASYDYYADVPNGQGVKQRQLEVSQYLIPGVQTVGDSVTVNNYQRESSVYVKTTEETTPLPFPSQSPNLLFGGHSRIEDKSRFICSQVDCNNPEEEFDISVVSYYGSIKNNVPGQWGQIYSYETIDTGFQVIFGQEEASTATVFGGDTFICKFGFKTKLPFFIDNRVGAPDDSDVFYDELGNVAYPEFWHSSRSILFDYVSEDERPVLKNAISIKAHNFDCPNSQVEDEDDTLTIASNPNRTFYDGKMYLFAYGIPYFFCESSINVDLRQAINNKEGDFYPHVGTGIPDDWLQESNVPIALDNSYHYNVTYSKQNKENFFSHLPVDWEESMCYSYFPYRAIISEVQDNVTDTKVNNWLIYRPLSYFDFPQNYGELVSLDGIQNKAVLARFENKSLLYNTLLTIDTSNPQAAYIGNGQLFKSAPPIDFAETDLGYMGSQHKFLLKIPQGQITVDAKRGQIFLISGNQAQDISALGSGLSSFLSTHLPFEILEYFPDVDIDNHFNGIGLHGVYDSTLHRVIISKLDYIPVRDDIQWDAENKEFYILDGNGLRKRVYLSDTDYFCNKSWTLSYDLDEFKWISFHSYIPNWYIADNNFFYSGINEGCDLEAIAAEFVPPTTTTTTTKEAFDCTIIGEIVVSTTTTTTQAPDCDLAGTVENTTTTTTTTAAPTTTTTTTEAPEGNSSLYIYARTSQTLNSGQLQLHIRYSDEADFSPIGSPFSGTDCSVRYNVNPLKETATSYELMVFDIDNAVYVRFAVTSTTGGETITCPDDGTNICSMSRSYDPFGGTIYVEAITVYTPGGDTVKTC